jgi:hypothetical protein
VPLADTAPTGQQVKWKLVIGRLGHRLWIGEAKLGSAVLMKEATIFEKPPFLLRGIGFSTLLIGKRPLNATATIEHRVIVNAGNIASLTSRKLF